MQKRKFDELVSYFNKKVSEMEIETKYKMELLGMVTALGCAYEKEMSDLSETKRDSSDTISRQAAINTVSNWLRAVFGVNSNANTIGVFRELRELPSAEPETSRIEQELHGKTPEEQYEFIYWLLFKSALGYSNSRLTIIEWLKGEKEDG